MKIPYDKQLHFGAGFVSSLIICTLTKSTVAGIGVALILGASKEIYDYFYGGDVEFLDVVATVFGGIIATLILLII